MNFHSVRMNNLLRNHSMRNITGFLVILFLASPLRGQQIPEPMVPKRLVNDFTGLLSESQQIDLNNKLLNFNNQTSTQIYMVTLDDLQGYPVSDYGVLLAEKWGIGQKGKDNGILILISPVTHKITIQTGYGLEGAVPDAIAKRLIENVITPAFKAGKYYAGLDSATNVLMSLTRGEFTADAYMKKSGNGKIPGIAIIIIIILFFIISGMFRSRRQYHSSTSSLPWWLLLGAGSSSRSGWGSFSSGGGSFGGGGGGFGGFSGGGGGSFGGGGASGGW
jgi:uncharacterized protein